MKRRPPSIAESRYLRRGGRGNIRPRLTEWRMKNFKSARSARVKLSPLTIVVGKNSSGKSTLLQSILFMAQNASSPLRKGQASRGILDLNGPLVSLGSFRDTLNDTQNENGNFELGGVIEWELGDSYIASLSDVSERHNSEREFVKEKVFSNKKINKEANPQFKLDWNNAFSVNSKRNDSFVLSVDSTSTLNVNAYQVQKIRAKRDNIESAGELNLGFEDSVNALSGSDYEESNRVYSNSEMRGNIETKFDVGLKRTGSNFYYGSSAFSYAPPSLDLSAVSYIVGLPVTGLVKTNVLEAFIKSQEVVFGRELYRHLDRARIRGIQDKTLDVEEDHKFQTLEEAQEVYVRLAISEMLRLESEESLPRRPLLDLNLIISLINQEKLKDTDENKSIYQNARELFRIRNERDGTERLAKWWMETVKIIKAEAKKENLDKKSLEVDASEYCQPVELAPNSIRDESFAIEHGASIFSQFLANLKYIFPLREEPRDIYPRSTSIRSDQFPIGIKGELLAELILNDEAGMYPIPENAWRQIDRDRNKTFTAPRFKAAMEMWLAELEISTGVLEAEVDRHLGYRLTLGGKPLRSVGFGVSQILPIIALCLVAKPGEVIVLQEPELHLNPSLQRSLADFFVAMVKSGRQIIVETHSEYLITRLRLLSVKDPGVRELLSLVFTYQERDSLSDQLESKYESVLPDSNGQLPDWPEGFFDQIPQDIQELLGIMLDDDEKKSRS